MTGGAEIRAAAARLTELVHGTVPEHWKVEGVPGTGEHRIIREYVFLGARRDVIISTGLDQAHADLIDALRRTAETQLLILAHGERLWRSGSWDVDIMAMIIGLARAINGRER